MLEQLTIIAEIISLAILINAIIKLYYFYDFKAQKNYYGMLFTMASYLMLVMGKFLTFSGAYEDYSGSNGKTLIVSLMLHYFILALLYSIIFIKNRAFRIFFFSIPVIIIFRGLIIQERHVFVENMIILDIIFFLIVDEKWIKTSHTLFLMFYIYMYVRGIPTGQPDIFIGSLTSVFGTCFLVHGFQKILYNNERWHN